MLQIVWKMDARRSERQSKNGLILTRHTRKLGGESHSESFWVFNLVLT